MPKETRRTVHHGTWEDRRDAVAQQTRLTAKGHRNVRITRDSEWDTSYGPSFDAPDIWHVSSDKDKD